MNKLSLSESCFCPPSFETELPRWQAELRIGREIANSKENNATAKTCDVVYVVNNDVIDGKSKMFFDICSELLLLKS